MNLGEMYTLGWAQLLNVQIWVLMFMGVLVGIILGILPGLGPTLAIAVLTPFTFNLDITSTLAFMLGMMGGGTYGGSISSILCNIPGTPVAMMTTLDGYPMGQQGLAGKAIGIVTISSCFGGLMGAFVLSFSGPAIAKAALKFSAPEYFAIAFFGISIIAYISPGSMIKGLISGILGLLLGVVGSDPLTAFNRFTFHRFELMSGIGYFPLLIGLFGAAETLRSAQRFGAEKNIKVISQIGKILPRAKELLHILPTVIRGGIIGTFIGAVPAAGGTISSIMAYGVEKRIAKDPETFGKGNIRGVAAPESANNASTCGAMIPLLTLGIPGDPGTAALMGVFLIHGLTLGPMLFRSRPGDISAIFIILLLTTLMFTVIGLTSARYLSKIITLPMGVLMPIVGLLCVVGVYSINNSTFDFIFLLGSALIGFLFSKGGVPAAPMVLGLVLGNLIESNFRRSLMLFRGNLWAIFARPIAGTFVFLTLFMLCLPSITRFLGAAFKAVRKR